MENHRRQKETKLSGAFSATFLIAVVCLLVAFIPFSSAANFDNIKTEKDTTFDGKKVKDDKLLEKYKPIEIKNWYGIGEVLFEGYLSKHDETCQEDCQSIIEVKLHKDGPLVDDIYFLTEQDDGSWLEQDVRSYQFSYWGDVIDYEAQCEERTGTYLNRTEKIETEYNYTFCEDIAIGSHEGWVKYNLGEEIPKGTYTVKLDAEKKPTRTVDWVMKTNGEWLTGWAVWNNNWDEWIAREYASRTGGANLTLSSGTTVLGGNLIYDTVFIEAGATLEVNQTIGYLNITAFNVTVLGTIDGEGQGSNTGGAGGGPIFASPCRGGGAGSTGSGGSGGTGGAGAFDGGSCIYYAPAAGGSGAGLKNTETGRYEITGGAGAGGGGAGSGASACCEYALGGSGGTGNPGGAAIVINSPHIIISGTVTAKGGQGGNGGSGSLSYSGTTNGGAGGGGGSGGQVILDGVKLVLNSSAIVVSGGTGGSGAGGQEGGSVGGTGGTGSGGRYKLFYSLLENDSQTTTLGTSGTAYYSESASVLGSITLNSPADTSISQTPNIEFNATTSISGGATIVNMSLWTNSTGDWTVDGYLDGQGTTVTNLNTGNTSGPTGWTMTITANQNNIFISEFYLYPYQGTAATYRVEIKQSAVTLASVDVPVTAAGEYIAEFGYNDYSSLIQSGTFTIVVSTISGSGNLLTTNSDPDSYSGDLISYTSQTVRGNGGSTVDILRVEEGLSGAQTFNLTISDLTLWNVQACDSDGDCGFAVSNYTVDLDATAPVIGAYGPSGLLDYISAGDQQAINATFTDSNIDTCWYDYNGTNVTIEGCIAEPYITNWFNSSTPAIEITTTNWVLKKTFSIPDSLNYSSVQLKSTHNSYTKAVRQDIIYDNGTTISQENSTNSLSYITYNFTNPNIEEGVDRVEFYAKEVSNNDFQGFVQNFYVYGNELPAITLDPDNLNMTLWANDTIGNINSSFLSWEYKIINLSNTYNSTAFTTGEETFITNVTANASLTGVKLDYNGTNYTMTNNGDGTWTKVLQIPVENNGTNTLKYYYTYGTETIASTEFTQNVTQLAFAQCNGAYTDVFANFTFVNENTQANINGAMPSATFEYYLGSGTVTNSVTISNSTELASYTFCSNAGYENISVDYRIQYQSTGYPQRVSEPAIATFSNDSVVAIPLYLLPTADGIYVTFQIVNTADQLLEDVVINAKRLIGSTFETISDASTDSSGTSTMWLNPDFVHAFTFTKSPYTTVSTSFAPTQTSYTITLAGGQNESGFEDYVKGILFDIFPRFNSPLYDGEVYDFNFTLASSYWDVAGFGFSLYDEDSTLLGSQTTTANGGTLSNPLNVSGYDIIRMSYYWNINGTFQNASKTYVVLGTDGTQWSINNTMTDVRAYLGEGMFGMTNFAFSLIVFMFLTISVGVMSFKFGLVSPTAISILIFTVVLFLDVGLDLMQYLNPFGIDHFITIFIGLIMTSMLFRELAR